VLEAIANNCERILLTLATGTGKTFIAFQIAWKLFQSRWNRTGGEPARRPRTLFLADSLPDTFCREVEPTLKGAP
jgi:type I restriction enzyme R subunit